jgi:hypothetical protein
MMHLDVKFCPGVIRLGFFKPRPSHIQQLA